ncbi:HEPN family nuclease [Flavobacterium sp. PLA-1-15]|uniref:HEPN family nuclease n=1 Tax=Flavobacterium sp. PLA-1-15 TaxID=3380533 RepID=UPI003B7F17B2
MGEIKNEIFDVEFITRTKKVISAYKGTYNITLLLNCLLGLIVLPSEYYNRRAKTFFNTEIANIPELNGLLNNGTFNPTKRKKDQWVQDKHTFKNLIKKVRNAVSHQQIQCVGNNGKWESVTLQDINSFNQNNIELEVTWTTKELRKFALFVADTYLNEIEKEKIKATAIRRLAQSINEPFE